MPDFNPKFPDKWEKSLWQSMNKPKHYMRSLHSYRGFKIRFFEGSPRLTSVAVHALWEGPTFQADARPTKISPFHAFSPLMYEEATHGIYSLKFNVIPGYSTGWYCYGLLSLSGTVVEHTYGYRAERATLREIAIIPEKFQAAMTKMGLTYHWEDHWQSWKDAFEDIYQCDVHYIPNYGVLVQEVLPRWTLENPNV
jgi:hypothetical protein